MAGVRNEKKASTSDAVVQRSQDLTPGLADEQWRAVTVDTRRTCLLQSAQARVRKRRLHQTSDRSISARMTEMRGAG